MGFTYETQGSNTFLVYEVQENQEIDKLTLGMMSNNKIQGISPVIFTQMDNNKYFKYNVSSKITGKQCFGGTVTKKRVLGVFSSMIMSILEAQEYMIDLESMVIDLEYIFIDVSSNKASLICVPVMQKKESVDLKLFFKNIIFSTQYDQSENCDYVAKIISYLNSEGTFSLVELKKLIDEILSDGMVSNAKAVEQNNVISNVENIMSNEVKFIPANNNNHCENQFVPKTNNTNSTINTNSAINTSNVDNGMMIPGMGGNITNIYNENELGKKGKEKKKKSKGGFSFFGRKKNKNVMAVPEAQPLERMENNFAYEQPKVDKDIPMQISNEKQSDFFVSHQQAACNFISTENNFNETTVLGYGSIGETTVLDEGQDNSNGACLIRIKNNERIQLNKPVFRIGKEKSYVDYFIGDNTAVSRSHASIINCDNEYFIEDTNSTNHTYIDGNIIQSNIKVKLSHGSKIKLANEEFEFRMY